jgi:HK97 family phage prohead protease
MSVIKTNLGINEDKARSWDSEAAIGRIKDWASDEDGNIDFTKYRKAFFWVDPDNKDEQGGYKLPFADVIDGDLKAVWRGVSAAMGALLGARGGVDIPDGDKTAIYSQISTYYKKFEETPPEMKKTADKGAIQDAIDEEENFEAKLAKMEPFREIMCAFYDVYYDDDTPADDFNTLLAELIGLMKQLLNGTYEPVTNPDEDEPVQMALANGVDVSKLQEHMFGKSEEVSKSEGSKQGEKLFADVTVKTVNDDGSFTAVASTAMVDRHGEVVSPVGWNLTNFKKNPVLLWAHDHSIPAIGKATKVWIDGKGSDAKLMFNGVWQTVTDYGKAASQLVQEGILNSFSVGFIPQDMDGNTYTKQELLEISLVNVPANPQAMMLAYKSLKDAGFNEDVMNDFGINTKLLDKLETMEKNVDTLQKTVDNLVKERANEETPPAPQTNPTKAIRTKQSLAKTIARASDRILQQEKNGMSDKDRTQMVKVIKRASEILIQSNKNKK